LRKIKKVLIANRGEIALRIIRSLISLDIEAVVVYEEADRDAYYLNFADEAILLGEEAGKNYLSSSLFHVGNLNWSLLPMR